tara:strand:+ start:1288 stop:1857 length:570 start_codon:yes stop_codon:yes gene_type:complete
MEFETKALEEVLSSFGSKLIEKARANLNKKDKRAKGTLFNEMSYDIEKTPTGVKFVMDFGSAEDYWVFVDQGVQGAGGFKGSGRKKGQGSPFKFGRKQPPLRAILPWISIKGIKGRDKKGRFITKKSLAFLIARSIKQRGIERTRFISKPYDDMVDDLKKDLTVAMAEDIDNSITIEEQPKLVINLSKK